MLSLLKGSGYNCCLHSMLFCTFLSFVPSLTCLQKASNACQGGTLSTKGAQRQCASSSQMLGNETGTLSNVYALCLGLATHSSALSVFVSHNRRFQCGVYTACFPFTFGKSLQSSWLAFLIEVDSFDSFNSLGIILRKFSQFLHIIFTTTGKAKHSSLQGSSRKAKFLDFFFLCETCAIYKRF